MKPINWRRIVAALALIAVGATAGQGVLVATGVTEIASEMTKAD